MRGRAIDALVYSAFRTLFHGLSRLPRQSAEALCRRAASGVYHLDRKHRRIGLINLEIAFPEESLSWRKEVLEESYRRLGEHVALLSRLENAGRDEIAEWVFYEPGRGLENYREARKGTDQGVLFITGHISAWELLPAGHAVLGHPLSFVVRPLDNPYLDRWMTRIRSRFGNRVLSKYGSIRELLRALRSGRDVGLLIDQNVQEKDGVYAPLFGRPACTTAAASLLALKTGCSVIPGFMIPRGDSDRFQIRFYRPFRVNGTGNRLRDLEEATRTFNLYLEEVIREVPHCWLWGHRRFRTQPDGHDPYE